MNATQLETTQTLEERLLLQKPLQALFQSSPEKENLTQFAHDVRVLALPLFASTKGAEYIKELADGVEKFASWIEEKAGAL